MQIIHEKRRISYAVSKMFEEDYCFSYDDIPEYRLRQKVGESINATQKESAALANSICRKMMIFILANTVNQHIEQSLMQREKSRPLNRVDRRLAPTNS